MNSKNNRTGFSKSNNILRLAILVSLCLLALLAGCSLEGDISAVMRKAGLYTIAFNANGATSGRAAAAMTVRANSAVTLPGGEGLNYPGYVFAGWNPDSSGAGSTYPAGAAYSGTRNVTLYAMWGDVATSIKMVWIPAGTFMMGSPASEPGRYNEFEDDQNLVTLTSGFYMGVYQITQEQYIAVMGINPSYFNGAAEQKPVTGEIQGKRPVERVSWYDALVFCNELSLTAKLTPAYSMPGYGNSTNPADWGTVPTSNDAIWDAVEIVPGSTGYRLPTEAQWEYAARAGTTTAFNDGLTDNWNDSTAVELLGWYASNSSGMTHEVGKKAANAWGLYDMHGNVSEWCWDWDYENFYFGTTNDPSITPLWLPLMIRVARGGSWNQNACDARAASWEGNLPSTRNILRGFRVSRP